MSTPITSSSETLLAPLHTQTGGPVELNTTERGVARTANKVDTVGHDTVELSVSAQVRQLVEQGQSASEIANTLGLTASLVDSYLYLPESTTGSNAAAQSATSVVL